jgi:DNA-binding CsgD family transcriptional regulator
MESMLCPVLIGRSAELGALTAALDQAAEGHGSAVFVTGDAGVGKSRLAKDVIATAAERGCQLMTGRATQSAVPVPYRPIAEALLGAARTGLMPDMPGISDYRAALGMLVPEWRSPADSRTEVTPVVIGEAILRMLTQPGPGGVLLLEDLHWADPETLAVVEYLADNAAGASALCVITLRDTGPSACLNLLQAATARRVAERIAVPRLSAGSVRQMAAACLDIEDVPASVHRLLADCDGLPFAVEEILAAAVSSGELARDARGWHVNSDISTGVPDSIAGSVRSRLAALGPEASGVIVSAAVLGRQFDWALLPGVAGVDDAVALDALQQAREVQLIEPAASERAGAFRFRHSLTRDSILADLLPPDVVARSAEAATAIERAYPGLPGTWCELVAELRAAAGQPADAARLLLMAGRRALAQGAVSTSLVALYDAEELLERAPQPEQLLHLEIDELLAEAFSLAGDYQQLAPLAEDLIARLAASGIDPRREALVRLRAASACPETDPAAAAAHLAAAADIAYQLQDRELASRIDAAAARGALADGDFDHAEALARRALQAARDAGLDGWAAEVALESLEVIGRRERTRDLGAARAAFAQARQIAERAAVGIWRIRALHELATIDMLEAGSTAGLAEVRDQAYEAGALSIGSVVQLQLANLHSLGPDLDEALIAARQCQWSAAQIKVPRVEAMAICLQANIAAIRGDHQQAEQIAARADRALPGDAEIMVSTFGQARVLAALFCDDLPLALKHDATAARHAQAALSARQRSMGYYSPLQAPLLAPRRALALHALLQAVSGADGQVAISQARAAGAAASWNAGCLAYAEAVLEGRSGHPGQAHALADEGSAHFAPFAPWWDHLVRRLVAPAAIKDGWGDPVGWLREAAREFETTHDQLAAACRGILRRAGAPVPRAGRGTAQVPGQMRRLGITSREMDVYLLVARGHSNSEIAEKLYISPKTVETHIASLVSKTGQAGRRQLVAHAARYVPS